MTNQDTIFVMPPTVEAVLLLLGSAILLGIVAWLAQLIVLFYRFTTTGGGRHGKG